MDERSALHDNLVLFPQQEYRGGESGAPTVGGGDQQRRQGNRDHERGLMKDAPQSRLVETSCDLFSHLHVKAPEGYRGSFSGRRCVTR